MSDRARAWLSMRAGPVPLALEARMESAIDEALDDDVISVMLADAARTCLRDAVAAGDAREAAIHLLAADALMTYACEAAASASSDELAALATSYSPTRLADGLDMAGAS